MPIKPEKRINISSGEDAFLDYEHCNDYPSHLYAQEAEARAAG